MTGQYLKKYFEDLEASELHKLHRFQELITEWNEKVNLISRKDLEQFELHHLMHSLALNKFVQFENYAHVLDLGTGGGLPGIPLAITNRGTEFSLIDSRQRKMTAVEDMVKRLELPRVNTLCGRAEELKREYDCIVCRAVTQLPKLLSWANSILKKQAKKERANLICLKGGNLSAELAQVNCKYKIHDIFEEIPEERMDGKYVIELWV